MKYTKEKLDNMSKLDKYLLCSKLWWKITELANSYEISNSYYYIKSSAAKSTWQLRYSGFFLTSATIKSGKLNDILQTAISKVEREEHYDPQFKLIELLCDSYSARISHGYHVNTRYCSNLKKAIVYYVLTEYDKIDWDKISGHYHAKLSFFTILDNLKIISNLNTSDILWCVDTLEELKSIEKIEKRMEKEKNANVVLSLFNSTKNTSIKNFCGRIIIENFLNNTFLDVNGESITDELMYDEVTGVFRTPNCWNLKPISTLESDRIDKLNSILED
jgi:hypothetical protein